MSGRPSSEVSSLILLLFRRFESRRLKVSVSSRPRGSFSRRFRGFPEGAFSMASYRIFEHQPGLRQPSRTN